MTRRHRNGPHLEFGATSGAYVGFVAPAVDREGATEETVVRELMQNALDASPRPALIEFKDITVPVRRIPCIDAYTDAFAAAQQHRAARPNVVISPNERQITDRIDNALKGDIRVLVCADSGEGISADALRRLYNTGDTAKNSGRGSVGVGHLLPFAASDLRFVLYAGRTAGGETTFGGHAIVATHAGKQRRRRPHDAQRESHGYIRGPGEDLNVPASQATGDATIPTSLIDWLPDTPTGSAVGIVGYNPPRRRPRGSATERVLREAAKNFLVAIADGNVTVNAATPDGDGTLNDQTLRATLASCRAEKTRLRSKGVAGTVAWEAYITVTSGERIDSALLAPGVRAWVRELPAGARTRVVFTREGMWISDDVSYNKASDFTGKRPFVAVVDSEPPSDASLGSLCALLRDAEGTSHWHITPGELTEPRHRQALTDGLLHIAATLRAHVADKKKTRIEPGMLRIFSGVATSPVAAQRAITTHDDSETASDDPDSNEHEHTAAPPAASRPRAGPPGGNTTGIRTACRHIADTKLAVAWQTDAFPSGDAGLRILVPSGADATCESPTGGTYLAIEAVAAPGATTIGQITDGEARLHHPALSGTATVLLAKPPHPDEAPHLRAELVHRRGDYGTAKR